jgi:hypothetical protein
MPRWRRGASAHDASSLRSARPIVASDVPGDAVFGAPSVDDGVLHVEGELGLARGSRRARQLHPTLPAGALPPSRIGRQPEVTAIPLSASARTPADRSPRLRAWGLR